MLRAVQHTSVRRFSHALDMGTQSLVLQAGLLCSSEPIPRLLLQKLANYVASGGEDKYGWRSRGADGVMRIVALSAYDSFFGSNEPAIDSRLLLAPGLCLLASLRRRHWVHCRHRLAGLRCLAHHRHLYCGRQVQVS